MTDNETKAELIDKQYAIEKALNMLSRCLEELKKQSERVKLYEDGFNKQRAELRAYQEEVAQRDKFSLTHIGELELRMIALGAENRMLRCLAGVDPLPF